MDINNPQQTICTSNLFPAIAIMQGNAQTGSTAVSCAFSGVVVVVQLAEEITNTFSHGSVAAIIMSQTLEAGRPAFTDLSASTQMDCFPFRNPNAASRFNHVQNNIVWCCCWEADLNNPDIDSNGRPGYVWSNIFDPNQNIPVFCRNRSCGIQLGYHHSSSMDHPLPCCKSSHLQPVKRLRVKQLKQIS